MTSMIWQTPCDDGTKKILTANSFMGPSVMKELKAAQYFPTKSAIIDFDRAFDMPIVAATLLPPH